MATDNTNNGTHEGSLDGHPAMSADSAVSARFQQDLENSLQSLADEGNELGRRLSHVQRSAQDAGLKSAERLAQLYKTYTNILWHSREIAGATKGTADDFRTGMLVLIEDKDIETDTKIKEIDGWLEDTRRQCATTETQPSTFRQLIDGIHQCLEDVKGEVEVGKFERTEACANISEMNQKLRELNEELTRVRNKRRPVPRPHRNNTGLGFGILIDLIAFLTYPFELAVTSVMHWEPQVPRRSRLPIESRQRLTTEDTERHSDDIQRKHDDLVQKLREAEMNVAKSQDPSAIAGVLEVIGNEMEKFYPQLTIFSRLSSRLVEDMETLKTLLLSDELAANTELLEQTGQFKSALGVESRVLGTYCRAPIS